MKIQKTFFAFELVLFVLLSFGLTLNSDAQELRTIEEYVGVSKIKFINYPECIELSNSTTRVVLGHHVGGRLLAYEHKGNNVLYIAPNESDWDESKPNEKPASSAGRFDIGPEWFQERGSELWKGEWKAEILGDRKARMSSSVDPKSGLQVYRDFTLDAETSRLTVRQTVENRSDNVVKQCYWSRTFAKHGGVAIVPCDSFTSRMPNLHVMYQTRYLLDFQPKDPAIRRVKNFLVIDGPTKYPKTGYDSNRNWVAYQTRDDLLFVKKYQVFPDKQYGEVSGMNLSLWYPQKEKLAACEIEPIGPLETLKPGGESSFTVDWWLLERAFPKSGVVDPEQVDAFVRRECVVADGK